MKCVILLFLIGVVIVHCGHTFLGTSVLRPLVYHHNAEYGAKIFQKRVENIYYSLPEKFLRERRSIKGILAYDLQHSQASANITQGGLGYNFVNIRMKSERGLPLHYDISIYT
ncbi:uncharacterized protein LOC128680585 [Plodia interpunctella]|uniref:uncharacterized protein LOC128680585 n=1 Tax=Plodia interpunctella TaxID=58824 RepID=UPI0023676D65|nr:uncharacterized protein LOC128680585 [Plodia interpunctella]